MKVTIIQRVLPHYRIPLYQLIDKLLKTNGIEFQLIYGQEYPGTIPKTVDISEKWAQKIDNRYINVLGKQLVWQPCLKYIKGSDLVIFEQANFLLVNYWLLLKRKLGISTKLAFWGHGKNMQAISYQSFSEKLKKRMINQVDWWFAYTELTTGVIQQAGFPLEKITVLQNAVDTTSLKTAISEISVPSVDELRSEYYFSSHSIALYCGGMYENKKLGFLIESCLQIKQSIPEFQLLLIGDGPEQYKVEQAAKQYEWVHYLGPKFGVDRATYFKLADVFLMPGLLGLAILDSFVAELPLFTTDIPIHSPEIAYLNDGENGFMSSFSMDDYAKFVISYLLADGETKNKIKAACLASAEEYTLENMANSFVGGIKQSLTEVH